MPKLSQICGGPVFVICKRWKGVKYIILAGVAIVVVGLVVYFFGNKLHWVGRLPGDIRVERENFRLYFPITTLILLSLVLTLIVNLLKRFF